MPRTVAHVGDVAPGRVRTFELRGHGAVPVARSRFPLLRSIGLGGSGERRIAVANVSGAFFAIDDTCTHRSCSLGDGALVGAILRCPCHGSRFDLTNGAVLEGPAEKPVRTYPARVVGDEIQVDL